MTIETKKIVGSTVSAILLFSALLWCARTEAVSPYEIEFALHVSVMVIGAAIGWIVGILASPYGEKKGTLFYDCERCNSLCNLCLSRIF